MNSGVVAYGTPAMTRSDVASGYLSSIQNGASSRHVSRHERYHMRPSGYQNFSIRFQLLGWYSPAASMSPTTALPRMYPRRRKPARIGKVIIWLMANATATLVHSRRARERDGSGDER